MSNQIYAEKSFAKTRILLLTGSLLDESLDVLVNAANDRLLAGGGICGAFHQEAGSQIFDECQEILNRQNRTSISTGEAVMTSSGRLFPKVKALIHAAGPIYEGRREIADQSALLADSYRNSLELTTQPQKYPDFVSPKILHPQPLRSIGFPSIGTGIYAFPIDIAAPVALKTCRAFIENNPNALDEIRFVFLPLNRDTKTAPAFKGALDAL